MKMQFACCLAIFAVVSLLVVACSTETESAGCVGRSKNRGAEFVEAVYGFAVNYSGDNESLSNAIVHRVYLVPAGYDLEQEAFLSPSSGSSLMLELLDSSGAVVRTVRNPLLSTMQAHGPIGDGTPSVVEATFLFQVSNPPVYDGFAFWWQEDIKLPINPAERSAHAPTVKVENVCHNQFFAEDAMIDVFLTGADQDNDELIYRIYYSVDAGETYDLYEPIYRIVDTTSNMFSVDASIIPGTDEARIGVSVTDGTRSAFAETPIFRIEQHTPTVKIVSPESGAVIYDETIQFYAGADDIDGDPPSAAYSWRSSLDGYLADGQSVDLDASQLTPGEHTISVTVTDDTNRTATDTIKITKEPKPPPPPTAVDDTFTILTIENERSGLRYVTTASLDVLANDTNIDPQTLSIITYPEQPASIIRTEYFNDKRVIRFRGRANTRYALTYQICNKYKLCDTATVTIHITHPEN